MPCSLGVHRRSSRVYAFSNSGGMTAWPHAPVARPVQRQLKAHRARSPPKCVIQPFTAETTNRIPMQITTQRGVRCVPMIVPTTPPTHSIVAPATKLSLRSASPRNLMKLATTREPANIASSRPLRLNCLDLLACFIAKHGFGAGRARLSLKSAAFGKMAKGLALAIQ